MTTNSNEDRWQLASKAAGYLPLIVAVIQSGHGEIYFQRSDNPLPIPFGKSPDNFILVGLMIEHLQGKGWRRVIPSTGDLFFMANNKVGCTETYSVDDLGEIEATVRAFVEACEIIGREGNNG